MNLKDRIGEFFPEATPINLPRWLDEVVEKDNTTIKSYLWETDKIRKIRLCELNVKNKFQAETLVIYPDFCYETPILGTEYLNINNAKFFGAVDLHQVYHELYGRSTPQIKRQFKDIRFRQILLQKVLDTKTSNRFLLGICWSS
jgi:hypothetical protein